MSEVRVNNIVDYGGKGAPTFDNGAVISGVSSLGNQAKIGSNVTITSGGINVSGVTTAATLSGNLTGDVSAGFLTATSTVIGSGVTINAGGLNITGVMTATTFEGSGASLTGVAMTITPLAYNPDVNDTQVTAGTGIGITFDHRILAGSGNVTLSVATNAGAAGTTVENFGVGSSVTISGRKASITPTSSLSYGDTYHISYPSGAFTNTAGDVSYVGTAYTFGVVGYTGTLWAWGRGLNGVLGQNSVTYYSSPVQIPGTTWSYVASSVNMTVASKDDGTFWAWGKNEYGNLGHNDVVSYSSPVQVPGTTWSTKGIMAGYYTNLVTKTDGTLWSWGLNTAGQLGDNSRVNKSSPVQIPGTNWSTTPFLLGIAGMGNIKTDGTFWSWGENTFGMQGQNNTISYSSPVQVPGTTWSFAHGGSNNAVFATKTDGTLWCWGRGGYGVLGQNEGGGNGSPTGYSSPVQIGSDTTWAQGKGKLAAGTMGSQAAIKTDGTLWSWGYNRWGDLGQNSRTYYSSPVQIPGTTWDSIIQADHGYAASKTDGTLWSWGYNTAGQVGVNNRTNYSSPVQIPGTTWSSARGDKAVIGRSVGWIRSS